MGGVGEAQPAAERIEVGIEERHEPVGVGQVLLGQLVEVVQDPIGSMAAEGLGPQHAPQQGHQQPGGHPLAHHIPHHQGPAPPLSPAPQLPGPGGDEVVVVAAHLEGRTAAGGQVDPFDHRAVVGHQLGLDLGADTQLTIHPLVAASILLQAGGFQAHTHQVGHQLHMAPVHLTPAEAGAAAEHVEPAAHLAAGHHGGGKQLTHADRTAHPLIQQGGPGQLRLATSQTRTH